MKAFDSDSGLNGKVTYKIFQRNYLSKLFKINEVTGIIASTSVIGMI